MDIGTIHSGGYSAYVDKKKTAEMLSGAEKTAYSKESSEPKYRSVSEYTAYLQKKFSYFGNGTANICGVPTQLQISSGCLQNCVRDPETAKNLEESLHKIPELISYSKSIAAGCGLKVLDKKYMIGEDGKIKGVITTTGNMDNNISEERESRRAEERVEKKKIEEKRAEERLAEEMKEKEKLQARFEEKISHSGTLQIAYNSSAEEIPTQTNETYNRGNYFDSYK